MSFMKPQVEKGDWWIVEDDRCEVFIYPHSHFNEAWVREQHPKTYSLELRTGKYGARMSAPGYLDCTDWTLFDTEEEAMEYLEEMYGDDSI